MNLLAYAALAAMLSACGGGSHAGPLPSTGTQPASSKNANAAIKLTIPVKSSSVKFVSASTNSITVSMNGNQIGEFDTTPTSTGCSAQNGATVCVFTVNLPLGSDTLNVNAYDQTGGAGNLLSSGSVTQNIVAGSNSIPLIMGGVVNAIVVGGGNTSGTTAGTAATIPLSVMAKDADGNVIIGPGNYSSPITLADSDASGITSIDVNGKASTTVNAPSDQVTLVYNGNSIHQATISASANGVTGSNLTSFVFSPAISNGVYITTPRYGSAEGIAYNAKDGYVYYSTRSNDTSLTDPSSVSIVQANSSGNVTEFDHYTVPAMPAGSEIFSLAVDGNGNVWFAEAISSGVVDIGELTPATKAVTMYTMPSGVCPVRLVLGADGNELWFASGTRCSGVTSTYAYGKIDLAGNVTPYNVTDNTNDITDLIATKDGKYLYLAGVADASIWQIPLTGSTPGTPVQISLGKDTGGNTATPFGLVQTSNGNIWFTQDTCNYPAVDYDGLIGTPSAGATPTWYQEPASCGDVAYGAVTFDDQVFFGTNDAPAVEYLSPNASGAPTTKWVSLPGYDYNYWQTAVDGNGRIWATDFSCGCTGVPNAGGVAYFSY